MRVLIADDSLTWRKILRSTLEAWGYEVIETCDGAQAWEVLGGVSAPPMAILDWLMPALSGVELCRMVRSRPSSNYTYLYLLTAKNSKEDIIEGLKAGADDYIVKPFNRLELEARLRTGRRIVDLQQQLLKVQEELRVQATRDALTGCWNRPAILNIFNTEADRALRERRPLGLVLFDLDRFKTVNDTWGHAAGDTVLRETVARVSGQMRSYDALGRYGGEEFLVILPGCDAVRAFNHAERLRMGLNATPVQLEAPLHGVSVSASFGVACLWPENPLPVSQLIEHADESLYEAKRKGRNRVWCKYGLQPHKLETSA